MSTGPVAAEPDDDGDERICTAPRVFLGTNVIAYQFDAGAPVKRDRGRTLLTAGEHDLSTQVLLELFDHRPVPREE